MSKIEEAAAVIRQLQAALGLYASMVAGGEKESDESTSAKQYAQVRANQWLQSLELPEQVREWPQYMQRVWIEKEELHERAKKCSEFIGHSPLFDALPSDDQELLKEQCEAMWQYFEIIGHRVARFINSSSKGGSPPIVDVAKPNVDSAGLVLPEFTPSMERLTSDNGLVRQAVEYPIEPVKSGLTLDKLAAVVEASESITRLETIEVAAAQDDQASAKKAKNLGEYWQEPEAVTVSVSMAPGAEPLSAEKARELDEYLRKQNKLKDEPEDFYPAISSGISRTPNQALGELAGSVKRLVGHFKETRDAPKLFNVQDSERPAFVIAHSFEEALSKWKVAVAEENATDSEYEEVPPAGIMHVCDGDELIIDQGFADKANS